MTTTASPDHIDREVTTTEGFTFVVVDVSDEYYVVRADATGNDASMSTGEQGVDWEYLYIHPNELKR